MTTSERSSTHVSKAVSQTCDGSMHSSLRMADNHSPAFFFTSGDISADILYYTKCTDYIHDRGCSHTNHRPQTA